VNSVDGRIIFFDYSSLIALAKKPQLTGCEKESVGILITAKRQMKLRKTEEEPSKTEVR
jgi:hypothetical protein